MINVGNNYYNIKYKIYFNKINENRFFIYKFIYKKIIYCL